MYTCHMIGGGIFLGIFRKKVYFVIGDKPSKFY